MHGRKLGTVKLVEDNRTKVIHFYCSAVPVWWILSCPEILESLLKKVISFKLNLYSIKSHSRQVCRPASAITELALQTLAVIVPARLIKMRTLVEWGK